MATELQLQENLKATYLGRHILAEFYDCNPNILNNVKLIEELMEQAAVECGATVVEKCFHMFNPYGVSGVVIISESHLTIHTWPEFGYASVDLYTCGETCDPHVAYEYMKQGLHAGSGSFSELKRGMFNESTNQVIKAPFEVKSQYQ